MAKRAAGKTFKIGKFVESIRVGPDGSIDAVVRTGSTSNPRPKKRKPAKKRKTTVKRSNPLRFAVVPRHGYSGNSAKVQSDHATAAAAKRAAAKSEMVVSHDGKWKKGRPFFMDTVGSIYPAVNPTRSKPAKKRTTTRNTHKRGEKQSFRKMKKLLKRRGISASEIRQITSVGSKVRFKKNARKLPKKRTTKKANRRRR